MLNQFPAFTFFYFDVFSVSLKLPVAGRKPSSITAAYLGNSSFSSGSSGVSWWARGPQPSSGCLIKWAGCEMIPRVMRHVKPSWCFIHENRCWLATGGGGWGVSALTGACVTCWDSVKREDLHRCGHRTQNKPSQPGSSGAPSHQRPSVRAAEPQTALATGNRLSCWCALPEIFFLFS